MQFGRIGALRSIKIKLKGVNHMGQAQRRKHLGLYPVVQKPKHPKFKFDLMDDMSEIGIVAIVLASLMSRRQNTRYLREDDFA